MSFADDYLVELGDLADVRARERPALKERLSSDPPVVIEQARLRAAAQPMLRFMIKLAAGQRPGTDGAEDAVWLATTALARRQIGLNSEAGIDGGLCELSLAVLAWIDSRIACRDDRAFQSRVRDSIDELLEARRRGQQRGSALRALREREGHPAPLSMTTAGFLLRHPVDHYFRRVRAVVSDADLCELLDAQIAILAASYERLVAATTGHDKGELVLALLVGEVPPHTWSEPIPATVTAVAAGPITVGDQVGLRLVADPDATFNGTLISVRSSERWLICADSLPDGTIIPRDHSRRIAA